MKTAQEVLSFLHKELEDCEKALKEETFFDTKTNKIEEMTEGRKKHAASIIHYLKGVLIPTIKGEKIWQQ